MTTQPGLGRAQTGSGDCSLLIITEPFLRFRLIKGKQYLNVRYHGHREPVHYTYMVSVTVQIVLSSAQMRLQKGLIPRPEQNDTCQISGLGWAWVRNFDRLPSLLYAEQRRARFGIYHPASPPQKYAQKLPK